ncbi:hypothetical protein E4Z66_18400 [Aliishimia ponticola]|uniref:Uncharacterized protein n=1 Tax=Aliishimia ponticola TaxID=2499833 RepID=A0A4S4N8N1_9RHOB|nr:hypothetical protein [Aliishimia ponticola]THH34408.1 hypothetical protein E4Z66_18400 [Aliishimia ponticola]
MKGTITSDIRRIRAEAEMLAGRPQDLEQRASVYLRLYRESGGRHVFPLLAAHGALWGAGHFQRGLAIGRAVAKAHRDGAERLARLADFATAFKEINRQVCVETYAAYHITGRLGPDAARQAGLDPALIDALTACHDARRRGAALSPAGTEALFTAFFRWEQDNVVHPSILAAEAALDWPLMRTVAMRPPVWFSYMRAPLLFRQFASKSERIDKGLRAFQLAQKRGWSRVEADIARYGRMPTTYVAEPERHYQTLLDRLDLRPLRSV